MPSWFREAIEVAAEWAPPPIQRAWFAGSMLRRRRLYEDYHSFHENAEAARSEFNGVPASEAEALHVSMYWRMPGDDDGLRTTEVNGFPRSFLAFDEDACSEMARMIPSEVAKPLTARLALAATKHKNRRDLDPHSKGSGSHQRALLARAASLATQLKSALRDVSEAYSLSECVDTTCVLQDLETLASTLSIVADSEKAAAKAGRRREEPRAETAAWVAELLARSGVKVTTTEGGAFHCCLRQVFRLSGESAPSDMRDVLRRAAQEERSRQERDGLQTFSWARAIGESEEDRVRRAARMDSEDERFARKLVAENEKARAEVEKNLASIDAKHVKGEKPTATLVVFPSKSSGETTPA